MKQFNEAFQYNKFIIGFLTYLKPRHFDNMYAT